MDGGYLMILMIQVCQAQFLAALARIFGTLIRTTICCEMIHAYASDGERNKSIS